MTGFALKLVWQWASEEGRRTVKVGQVMSSREEARRPVFDGEEIYRQVREILAQFVRSVFVGPVLLIFRLRPIRLQVGWRSKESFPTLWVDVTRTFNSTRVTGIERVTREISRALITSAAGLESCLVGFFCVNSVGVVKQVGSSWLNSAPSGEELTARSRHRFARGDTVLLLDHSLPLKGLNRREVKFLQKNDVKVASLIYDVLPLTHPKLFPWRKKFIFSEWIQSIMGSDGLIFISEASKEDFKKFRQDRPSRARANEVVVPLGSQLRDFKEPARIGNRPERPGLLRLLAVGTLEPRKGYEEIIDALEILWHEQRNISLTIVGRRGWKCSGLIRRIRAHPRMGADLVWREDVADEELLRLIDCHDLLIANSVAEGYGLPLVEAAAAGLPVVARDIPVFREVLPSARFFSGGGPRELADALRHVREVSDPVSVPIRQATGGESWTASAQAIRNLMHDLNHHEEVGTSTDWAFAKARKSETGEVNRFHPDTSTASSP